MTDRKTLQARGSGPFQKLRDAVRSADEWPVAGSAVRRFLDAESWAMAELKQRLDAIENAPSRTPTPSAPDVATPSDMLADLVQRSHYIDPDAARDSLYRQTLHALVPDQVAMLALLAKRGQAPLVHVAASRLPAGPINMIVLANASSLGRDAGVLLREYVPQYMTRLIDLGVFEVGSESDELDKEYELLMADTQLRKTISRVRNELRMYPRVQRFSIRLSDYGQALWNDCRPPRLDTDTPEETVGE